MNQDTRQHFAEQLDEVKARLLVMGELAEERVTWSIRGLVEHDRDSIDEVIHGDEIINKLHLEIDDRCFKLLALQQPMAVDLRMVVAALKINTDLERVGDLAVNIGEAAVRIVGHTSAKPQGDLVRMGQMARGMLHDALRAFLSGDVDRAQAVIAQDDELDKLKNRVFRDLLADMLRNKVTIEPGIDLILIARHLERVGDHATNIAEDVVFIIEARDIRHHTIDPVP